MAGRKPQEPPPLEIKQFTPDEIDRALLKLKKRIEDVRALDPRSTSSDDQRVTNAAQDIRNTLLEIFGANSPEYRDYEHHRIWHGPEYMGMEEHELRKGLADGVVQTITMLEGLVHRLEEKRTEHTQDPIAQIRSAFGGLDLHPRIASVSAQLFEDGHYRNAVLDAAVALVNFVKEKSRRHDLDGAALMRTVFSRNNPILAFNTRTDQSDLDEQEGLMHLFEGAVLALRNPRAHAIVPDTAEFALEYIALMSLLAKRLDAARRPSS